MTYQCDQGSVMSHLIDSLLSLPVSRLALREPIWFASVSRVIVTTFLVNFVHDKLSIINFICHRCMTYDLYQTMIYAKCQNKTL